MRLNPYRAASDGLGTDIKVVEQFLPSNFGTLNREYGLEDFPTYGFRLQNVQNRMREWDPRRLREIITVPYKGALTFYAFWFSVFIGLGGLASLILTGFQLLQKT
jgi:hypothetical protein